MQPLQHALHVGGEIEGVRNDDDVEGALQVQLLARLDEEMPVGEFPARGLDLHRGDVDPRDVAGPQSRQELAAAAADLQHPRIRGDQEVVVVGQEPAVAAGGRGRGRRGVEELPHGIEVGLGQAGEGGHGNQVR